MPLVSRWCECCGKEFKTERRYVERGQGRFCTRTCAAKINFKDFQGEGVANPGWKGGMTTSKKGYVYVHRPDHPRAGKSGYVKRADLVLEEKLGRPLALGELAHHENENKADDSPDNLSVMTLGEHTRQHMAMRPRRPPAIRPCACCGALVKRSAWRMKKEMNVFCSLSCSTKFWRSRSVVSSSIVVM